MDAFEETSPLPLTGGPLGGNSGCCSVGVTTFEVGFEVLPDRRPDDELDPELRDLLRWALVLVRLTILVDGCELCFGSVAVALVNVNVKYCMSSMLQLDTMQVACMACEY